MSDEPKSPKTDSPEKGPPREAAEASHAESGKPPFDPYRYQVMTVPPGLRSEMLHAKLPRLSEEYFQDTVPPNRLAGGPPPLDETTVEPVASEPDRETQPPRTRGKVIAVTIGALLFSIATLAVYQHLTRPTEAPASGALPATQPSNVEALPAPAPPAPVAPEPPAASAEPIAPREPEPSPLNVPKPASRPVAAPPTAKSAPVPDKKKLWVTPR